MSVKWHGEKAKADAKRGAVRGLEQWAGDVLEKAQAIVPVSRFARGGYLRDTGKAEVDAGAVQAAVSFDSPPGKHLAIYVHERMNVRHPDGKQAKFLEQPLNASRQSGPATMRREIAKELAR